MLVLGLNHGEIKSSAALVEDGRVIAGAPEERFNRQKRSRAFPRSAVKYCLETGKAALEDCAAVAQAWNPGAGWEKFNGPLSGQRSKREDYFYTVPDNLLQLTDRTEMEWVQMSFPGGVSGRLSFWESSSNPAG